MTSALRLFFTGDVNDTRPDTFFHLAYNGTDYETAINASNVNSIVTEPIYQVMLEKNYKTATTTTNTNKISDEFKTFVKDVGANHRAIDDGNIVASSSIKNDIFANIYRNFNTLPNDVRKLYQAHLSLIDTSSSSERVLHESEYATADANRVRFNFIKVTSSTADKGTTKFAASLPILPENTEQLKKEYKTPAFKTQNKKFNLNLQRLIANVIKARDTKVPPSTTSGDLLPEDLYESVVTGVRYARDDSGGLRKVGSDGKLEMSKDFEGTELENALNIQNPNCASTGLDIAVGCDDVYKCLLSGKPEVLSECLDRLRDQDMFAKARKEVANMNPKVAVQLLRTFGFKPRKEGGSNLMLPPTFEEWSRKLKKTVGEDTAKTISDNKKLMEYLRAVVDIVRSNPAIINKDLKNGVTSDFAKKSGLSVFRNPFPDRKVPETVIDGLLFAPEQFAQPMRLPLAFQLANLSGRVPGLMYGGGKSSDCPTASNIRDAFNGIYAQMEKNGKVLVDSDKARISGTIDKLEKLETQLMSLMDDAKLFTKLHSALNPTDVSSDNVTLNDIVNVKSESITGDTLVSLNDYINKNLRDQSTITSQLWNGVQLPLLQLLLKGGSNALSPVN
jgi:hypothetical protein